MDIKRPIYLEKLISRKNNGMIKVITGVRRCGKSYLLFNIFKDYLLKSGVLLSHIIEIDFDHIMNENLKDPHECYLYLKSKIIDNDMYYFLLDEIQLLDKFESVLNSFLKINNVDIYVTGSNARFLSKDVITEFRGRGDQVHIYPLCFSEFYSFIGGDKDLALLSYITYGGLPRILSMSSHEQKAEYLENLCNETYLIDIINRNNIVNKDEIKELFNIIASDIGSLTNPRKLANTFSSIEKISISEPTIKKYIEYLLDSFLINKAIRYNIKGKKYIDTPAKYYFVDLGLRNSRLNFRQIEETHLFENLIYNELIVRGYSVDVGEVTTYSKVEGIQKRVNIEIDFVCNRIDKRIYIQSALTIPTREKMKQEERPLVNLNDSFKKVIITKDMTIPHYNEEGIYIINIYDFLLNPDSLD